MTPYSLLISPPRCLCILCVFVHLLVLVLYPTPETNHIVFFPTDLFRLTRFSQGPPVLLQIPVIHFSGLSTIPFYEQTAAPLSIHPLKARQVVSMSWAPRVNSTSAFSPNRISTTLEVPSPIQVTGSNTCEGRAVCIPGMTREPALSSGQGAMLRIHFTFPGSFHCFRATGKKSRNLGVGELSQLLFL